jgi:hypothetical protein
MKNYQPIPRLTLTTTVAYREVKTGRYFEPGCMDAINGKAMPASFREVGWRDPGCAHCGAPILSQRDLGAYSALLAKEGTTVEAEAEAQRLKETEVWLDQREQELVQQGIASFFEALRLWYIQQVNTESRQILADLYTYGL